MNELMMSMIEYCLCAGRGQDKDEDAHKYMVPNPSSTSFPCVRTAISQVAHHERPQCEAPPELRTREDYAKLTQDDSYTTESALRSKESATERHVMQAAREEPLQKGSLGYDCASH